MIPIIINNCEYILSREADVQVISEYDESSDEWTAHAVHFTGIRRISVATGSGKTDTEAIYELHKSTAQRVRRHNESTGILQFGNVHAHPLPYKKSLYDIDFETTVADDSGTELNDIDDVISLSDDDDADFVEGAATFAGIFDNEVALALGRKHSPPKNPEEIGDRVKQQDEDGCKPLSNSPDAPTPTGPPPSRAIGLRSKTLPAMHSTVQARSRPPQLVKAVTSSLDEAKVRRNPRKPRAESPMGARCSLYQPLLCPVPSRPWSSGENLRLRKGELSGKEMEITQARQGRVILNVTWAGRRGSLIASHICHMHSSLVRDMACRIALDGSAQYSGNPAPLHLDLSTRQYVDSTDGKTQLIATIKRVRQGNRTKQVPPEVRYLQEVLWDDSVPEFDVEVQEVLPLFEL